MQVNKENPAKVFRAFKKGFEVTETYWTYRQMYLSNIEQGHNDSAAAFMTRVKDLVSQCQWTEAEREGRHIDLYYHGTEHFDIRCYIQNESAREGNSLMWDKVVDKAKCQECVGKEYARYRKEKGSSSTPSYGGPSFAADTMSRGFKRPQPRPQRQSGGSGGGYYSQQCNRCGKHNGCNGKKGNCQAWGKECSLCKSPTTTKQHAGVVPRRQ